MNGYMSAATGEYYEGDRAHPLDTEVPQRPDHRATWDGSEWVLDSGKIASDDAQQKIAALEAKQTPRLIREATLGGEYAKGVLADIDAQIAVLRGQLK